MTRPYTRVGDDGRTYSPFARARVDKDDPCIAFLGDLDEAEAWLGLASAALVERQATRDLAELVDWAQELLFRLGFHLAGRAGCVSREDVESVERAIDRLGSELGAAGFVLHGGALAPAALAVARAVVRRAERSLVACLKSGGAPADNAALGLALLNRLSDLLYVLELAAARRLGAELRPVRTC